MQIQYANAPVFCGATDYLPGEFTTDASGAFGVKKPNGKWLSVQPNSTYEERDKIGPWETFSMDSSINVLLVNPDVPYKIAYKGV